MWHDNLNVLWDGESLLVLCYFRASYSDFGSDAVLRVYSATDETTPLDLVDAFAVPQTSPWMRPARILSSHRTLQIWNSEKPNSPLKVTLNSSTPPEQWREGADRRFVLQNIADDVPEFLTSRIPIRADHRRRLNELANRLASDGAILTWATVAPELRAMSTRSAEREIGPSVLAYPANAQSAQIEIFRLGAQQIPREIPESDDTVTAIWSILDREPVGVYSIEVRTSLADDAALAAQERTAIIHVRNQPRYFASISDKWKAQGRHVVALTRKDILAAMTSEGKRPVNFSRGEDDKDQILVANLRQALAEPSHLPEGISLTLNPGRGVATITFDQAVLGDDVGLVSTSPGLLRRRTPEQANAADIVMFRAQAAELAPLDIAPTDPLREELLSAAANAEGDSTDDGTPPVDQTLMEARHRVLETLASAIKEATQSVTAIHSAVFDGLELLVCAGFIGMLQESQASATHVRANLAAYRDDPALCAAVVTKLHQSFVERQSVSATSTSGSLVVRLMRAIGMPSDARAKADIRWQDDAFDLLSNPEIAPRLIAARIYFDGLGDVSPDKVGPILEEPFDLPEIRRVARSLTQRVNANASYKTDAELLSGYDSTQRSQGWTSLSHAMAVREILRRERLAKNEFEGFIAVSHRVTDSETVMSAAEVAALRARLQELKRELEPKGEWPYGDIDLENCDADDLSAIESKIHTASPEYDRHAREVLKSLEKWAKLPDYLERAQSRFRLPADTDKEPSPTDIAQRFVQRSNFERSGMTNGEGRNGFSLHLRCARDAVMGAFTEVEAGSEKIQNGISPMADAFLHSTAFRAVQKVCSAAEDHLDQPAARRLKRMLTRWPFSAPDCWDEAQSLNKRLPLDAKVDMETMVAPPSFNDRSANRPN
jgi:hypothetical protein